MDYISCGYPDMSYHGTRAWYPDYTNYSRTLGIMLYDRYCQVENRNFYQGMKEELKDDTNAGCLYYMAYNMHWENHEFDLPRLPKNYTWKIIYNSAKNCFAMEESEEKLDKSYIVPARTVILLKGEYDESLQKLTRGKNETIIYKIYKFIHFFF